MTTASFPFCNPPTTNLPGLHLVAGRFKLDSGSEVPEVVRGKGFTVSRVNDGIFRVTFNRTVKVITFIAQVAQPDPRITCHHKDIADDVNTVDVVVTDYEGAEVDGTEDIEFVDFIAVVMAPATSMPHV